jgi:myo-inositol 2-dehydrogenase/D-chiro-inositol 1-dehydrogenase
VLRAVDDAPGLLMVGHVTRFEPDHRGARDLAVSGELGTVRMLSHSVTSSLPGWTEGGWLADPALSGGPLLDQAVHSFDFARWLIGSPAVRVTCFAADSPAGPATYALATVRYADGAIATVECSWAHPEARGFKLSAEVVGTQGRLTWSNSDQMGGVLHPRSGDPEWWDVLTDRGFRLELRTFVEAIRAGGPSPVPAAEAAEALHTALGAVESARTGRSVDLTTWEGA